MKICNVNALKIKKISSLEKEQLVDDQSNFQGAKAHLEMGSSDERAVLQLEDENLVRLEHFDRKASSLGTVPQRSSYDLEADDDSHKSIL